MSTLPTNDCFILVIKTDSYAGNFERQMCGYMTGQTGECGVGDQNAVMFVKDCPGYYAFENLVIQFPDENGCCRPVTIWESECKDVAIFFESLPTDEQLIILRQRARQFAAMTDPIDGEHKTITISGFKLLDYRVKHTEISIASWEGKD